MLLPDVSLWDGFVTIFAILWQIKAIRYAIIVSTLVILAGLTIDVVAGVKARVKR